MWKRTSNPWNINLGQLLSPFCPQISLDSEKNCWLATPMIENDAITEIKNELCAIHPFGERFAQSLFFEEKLADALDARLEGFEKLQKQLSAFVDATLLLDSSDLSTSQRLALYMGRDFQAATAMCVFYGSKNTVIVFDLPI